MPLPLPPVAEQVEIVRRVQALFDLAYAIERHVGTATSATEKVRQAGPGAPLEVPDSPSLFGDGAASAERLTAAVVATLVKPPSG